MKRAWLTLLASLGLTATYVRADEHPVAIGAPEPAIPAQVEKASPLAAFCNPAGQSCGCKSDWSGAYVGLNLGGTFNNSTFVHRGGRIITPGNNPTTVTFQGTFNDISYLAGGLVGYNWQFGALLLGIEGDWNGTNLQDTITLYGPTSAITHFVTQNLDWFGTVRGRIGYAGDNYLVYFTAGYAYGQVSSSSSTFVTPTTVPPTIPPDSSGAYTRLQSGYTFGGGLQYKLSDRWSVKAEYQYIDLNHSDYRYSNNVLSYTTDLNTEFHVLYLGLVYQLGRRS